MKCLYRGCTNEAAKVLVCAFCGRRIGVCTSCETTRMFSLEARMLGHITSAHRERNKRIEGGGED